MPSVRHVTDHCEIPAEACSPSRRRPWSSPSITSMRVTSPSPTSWSAWPSSSVALPSSSPACGSSPQATPSVLPVSRNSFHTPPSRSNAWRWWQLRASFVRQHMVHDTWRSSSFSPSRNAVMPKDIPGSSRPATFTLWLGGSLMQFKFFFFLAFSSYGAFWLSFATLLIPGSGIGDAYGTDAEMEQDAIGIYLLAWMIVTFLFL
jgi:hypothetical protein